ncbi:hypothetical protein PF008_g216 [Phytophthora fragariae]|uniref:Uncharacterized protein n=1 Tax=Phytophthora fragariae TaxID=53985 RepID=A0A6G0SNN6_9STRA|nr:hypothetical protein PF008_g216 [Phytophthora fragariae]
MSLTRDCLAGADDDVEMAPADSDDIYTAADVQMDASEALVGSIDALSSCVADAENDEEVIITLLVLQVAIAVALSQLDGRSVRRPPGEITVVRSDFFPRLKANRSLKAYRRTVRCSPESFDKLQAVLEPLYYKKFGLPGKNAQYSFDYGLAVLLTYYGNGCGQDGDGIGGAANQLGVSRTAALRYIHQLEDVL